MNNYLVTGGAGFIGSNLVRHLVAQQHRVHIFATPQESLWRLAGLDNFIIVHRADLRDFETVSRLIGAIQPKIIFHLASFGGMPGHLDQKMIFDVNFLGTVHLLNACISVGFDCFINTGSSSEYGIKQEAMHEYDVLEPVSDYAVAKAAATQFCLKEAKTKKLPVYTLRPFSVYGPYEMKTRLIPTILLSVLKQTPMHLSSPTCVRDFVYVDDVVAMYMMLAQQKPTSDYIFNAGSGSELRVCDVVEIVKDIAGTQCPVEWGKHQQRPWEPEHWRASIEHARSILGWSPHFTLAQGLSVSLTWFAHNKDMYREEEMYVSSTRENHCHSTAR